MQGFADDLVVLVDSHARHSWIVAALKKRLREEFEKLRVEINEAKSRMVDLRTKESFGFLGFDFRRIRSLKGVWWPQYTPKLKKRTAALAKLRDRTIEFAEVDLSRKLHQHDKSHNP